MKRPAVLVLLLTFVALVAATLWVPCRDWWVYEGDAPLLYWRWVWTMSPPHPPGTNYAGQYQPSWAIDYTMLALQYAPILCVGGLLALALHLRARRGADEPAA